MQRTTIIQLVLLSILSMLGSGQIASWYSCDPSSCQGNCKCASNQAPVANPPQFIVLTQDDAVTSLAGSTFMSVVNGFQNPNGCPIPATWFTTVIDSIPEMIQYLYNANHEIADHTVNHPSLPSREEILNARTWLTKEAGVPTYEIRGFRAPFLAHNVAQRSDLYSLGFTYDSSITQQPNSKQLFPFTMDRGVAIDCSVGTGTCTSTESYPGMWELPMWTLPGARSMDITGNVYEQYMNEFLVKYNGNRSPLGVFSHPGWIQQNVCQLRQFLNDALKNNDVWFVTSWQLLQWMRDPVDASTYRQRMTKDVFCPRKPPGPLPPASGCLFGKWDSGAFQCKCTGGDSAATNGFCRSSTGACETPKNYINGLWTCPDVIYQPPTAPNCPVPMLRSAPLSRVKAPITAIIIRPTGNELESAVPSPTPLETHLNLNSTIGQTPKPLSKSSDNSTEASVDNSAPSMISSYLIRAIMTVLYFSS